MRFFRADENENLHAARGFEVVVFNATDAAGLRQKLLTDGFSLLKHDAKASKELLDDDQLIGGLELGIKPEIIVISSAEIVFAE